jgi:acyl dehydratase
VRVADVWFEDYVVGVTRTSAGRTITEADVVIHAGQTGDFYPHHMDAEWCRTQPFGQRMAHGTLIMSIAVGATTGDMNPQAMSYGYERVRFVRPVFIGDTITVRAEIVEKRLYERRPDDHGIVEEQVTVSKQDNEVVMVLRHLYLVNRRPTGLAELA